MKFSASKQNFSSTKYSFAENGELDQASKEAYTASDNTAYTIKGNVVECTVDGKPYFRMTILKIEAFIECEFYFYNKKQKYHASIG